MSADDRRSLGKGTMTKDEALAKAALKSERDLQDLISEYLRMKNIVAVRSRMDKKTTVPVGTPDFVFAVRVRETPAQ